MLPPIIQTAGNRIHPICSAATLSLSLSLSLSLFSLSLSLSLSLSHALSVSVFPPPLSPPPLSLPLSLSLPPPSLSPPPHSLPLSLSLPPPFSLSLSLSHALCCNRICKNHSKARYNLLLFVHNTPIHPTYPRPQSHKVPCG